MSNDRKIGIRGRVGLLVLGAAALLAPIADAAAASYQVLYNFCSQSGCADGAEPNAGLVMDAAGNLYGTTWFGGITSGVVFKLAPDGSETVLRDFCQLQNCPDGSSPAAGLVMDAAGNLYGTTVSGGSSDLGVVFGLFHRPPPFEGYRYRLLYDFCAQSNVGCADGYWPYAGLIIDAAGNLYGTTAYGGDTSCYSGLGCGTAFKLAPDGTETVLYSFCQGQQSNCTDGYVPTTGLVMDAAGNLYGTTPSGGTNNSGVVFKLAPDGTETVLYSFRQQSDCLDGGYPYAGLVMDAAGNLYGTTKYCGGSNIGVVFKLAPDGTETVLYSFGAQGGGDGGYPVAGLVMDAAGNLYGTTAYGGAFGQGVVFKLAPDGTETVLYSFCAQSGCADGANPVAGLVMDAAGNLYGTTVYGGLPGVLPDIGAGVVFMVTP
jgi:uncharacterized repeat protein (TIGR03803 family)